MLEDFQIFVVVRSLAGDDLFDLIRTSANRQSSKQKTPNAVSGLEILPVSAFYDIEYIGKVLLTVVNVLFKILKRKFFLDVRAWIGNKGLKIIKKNEIKIKMQE